MNNVWVILNETKDAVVAVFETEDADSKPHWDLFFQHPQGCVFCGRLADGLNVATMKRGPYLTWYYNYFYWEDTAQWGIGLPIGIAWSAAMTLPEPIKMLELVGGMYGSNR